MENTASASSAADFDGMRVLVAEEDPLCLVTLTRMLQSCGYQVTAKPSPEEALRKVRRNPDKFDLVMSVARTEGTGIDGFGLVKHLGNRLPVILFSVNESVETVTTAIQGGAIAFLAKPLEESDVHKIWKHVARWRFDAANGSDPRKRRSAGVANHSSEGSSRGVQQQQRTTRKTRFNSSPPRLHTSVVQAAELLRGTEGYCPRGIRELLAAQGVQITIEQATCHLETYERDCLNKHLSAETMDISSRYDKSKNYLRPGSSGSYMRSPGATNINQTSLLSNDALPVGHDVFGNKSYRASHVGHLHSNVNHHGNANGYGNHYGNINFNGNRGNGYGHHYGSATSNGNANGYRGNGPANGLPANGSMVSAFPSFNQAHQVQQAMPTTPLFPRLRLPTNGSMVSATTPLFPRLTLPTNRRMVSASTSSNLAQQVHQAMPTTPSNLAQQVHQAMPTTPSNVAQQVHQAMPTTPLFPRHTYNAGTGGITMAPSQVDDGDDLLRSYLGEKEVMQNTATPSMTQGMHGDGDAGQTSGSHHEDLITDFFNWESTNGNGTTGTSDGMEEIE